MIKTKFVFAVSMVAMMAVNVANAKIAATTYVDKGVTTATNAANAAQTSANAANTAAGKAQTSANNAQNAADNAQASADAAAASAQTANEAVALKQDKLTAGTNITISGNTISAKDTTYGTGNGTTSGLTKLYTGTGSSTDGTMTQKAITDSLATKQATLTTSNIKGSGSVSVGISNGVITVSGTDNNTTYSTGNGTTSGLTKLYTSTGSNTDGTMTQKAITDSLGNKLDKTANAVSATKATQDGNGNVITSTYEKVANKVTSVDGDSDDTHYPTAKAVYDYAESVRSEISEGNVNALALKQDKSTAVTHTANTAAGSVSNPVYVNASGVATKVTSIASSLLPAASASAAGISKLGIIPSGTDKSGTAEIWVE